MPKFIKLTMRASGEQTYVNAGLIQNFFFASGGGSTVCYVGILPNGDTDHDRVLETPEEILALIAAA